MTNEATPHFSAFTDMAACTGPRNVLHLMFDPKGMRPHILNWEAVAEALLQRVYRESVGRIIDEKMKELLTSLRAYPDVKVEWQTRKSLHFVPIIPVSFVKGDQAFSYFSMVTTVGTPQSISTQELRIECMFPADEQTESGHMKLLGHPV